MQPGSEQRSRQSPPAQARGPHPAGSPPQRQGSPADEPAGPFRSKSIAGLLALAAGVLGAHRLYLGARFWWIYPVISMPALGWALRAEEWYREPAFFVAALVAVVSLLEAIVLGLTRDERWDARWNPGSARRSASGWPAVLIVIAALILGAILLMSVMAIALEGYFAARLGRG